MLELFLIYEVANEKINSTLYPLPEDAVRNIILSKVW